MHDRIDISNIVLAVAFSALGLLFPLLFHLLGLGSMFLPMYLPLIVGAFMLDRGNALMAGLFTPLASALITGMPPFYPPIAFMMSLQLGLVCLGISWLAHRQADVSRVRVLGIVLAALLFDRALLIAVYALIFPLLGLNAGFYGLYDAARGLPGLILICLAAPAAVPKGVEILRRHSLRLYELRGAGHEGHEHHG